MPLYTVDVQPGVDMEESDSGSGKAILEDLRGSERKLVALLELLAAVEGKAETKAGPRELNALVTKCRENDIEVHPAIDAWLVTRELETMEVDSAEFKACLDAQGGVHESRYGISLLASDSKMQIMVQRRVICKHLENIMEQPRNSTALTTFVAVVLQIGVLCTDLSEEFEDLQRMLTPGSHDAGVLKRLSQCRRKYIGYMLDTKPTGIETLQAVATEWQRRLADRQLGAALTEATESLQSLDKVELTPAGCLRKAMAFKICHLTVVKSKQGSEYFQTAKADELAVLEKCLVDARNLLVNHFSCVCAREFVDFMKVNKVLSLNGDRFKELDFDSMTLKMKSSLDETKQRLSVISEAEDPLWKAMDSRESQWLGLAAGLRKYLASVMHASIGFLDDDFEAFRSLVFTLVAECQFRDATDILSALREKILDAALVVLGAHEKVLAACALCVRGEFAEVSLSSAEQAACWELVGHDEVGRLHPSHRHHPTPLATPDSQDLPY